MGGSAPSAPTLDVGQSADLLRQQLAIQRREIPRMAEASGTASRSEYRRNIDFGLGLLGDASLRQRYEDAMPDEMRRRNALLAQLDAADASSPEYTRLQEQLQGAVGERAGMLSAQDTRDATQQARAAMAARGMATGNAGIGAELLNRDRFVQQRRAQDLGILGQSALLAEQERMRRMGLGQDSYNFALSSNPNMMAIGAGTPYANLTQNSMAMVGGASGLNPMYSGGQFSGQGGGAMGSAIGTGAGAILGGAVGSLFGGVGAVPGAMLGASLGGGIGGAAGGMSDEREKTDIKKIDGTTNVIGIPSYEYRYKGEKKKRRGVMAQDVQKVLPEAVAEVDYKGKKRLAIKPAVIGAALAEHLAADTKPVALAS
jgi:hypothetical protein